MKYNVSVSEPTNVKDKITQKTISKSGFGIIALLFLLLFQNIIEQQIEIFKIADEMVAFFFLVYIIVQIGRRKKWSRDINKIVFVYCLFMVMLTISTIINSKQPFVAELLDFIAVIKFPLVFIGAYLFFEKKRYVSAQLSGFLKLIISSLFIYFLFDLVFNFHNQTEYYINGMFHVITLGFGHETFLNASVIILLAGAHLLIGKYRNIYIMMCFILLAFTFKAKAYLFFAAYIFFYYFYGRKISKKVLAITLCAITIYFFVVDKIIYYWSGTGDITARSIFLTTSIMISINYFPLGLGLGNFGSYVARDYYPQYYYDFGFDNIWGLYPDNPLFFSDHFWPTILGEAGVVGCMLYIMFLYMIYHIIRRQCTTRRMFLGCVTPVLYIISASLAESAIFNSYSALYGISMALFLRFARIYNEKIARTM